MGKDMEKEELEEEYLDLKIQPIELIDEDDKIVKFVLEEKIEYEGEQYAVLKPYNPEDSSSLPEIVILRFSKDGKALEILDEKLHEEIYEQYEADREDRENDGDFGDLN